MTILTTTKDSEVITITTGTLTGNYKYADVHIKRFDGTEIQENFFDGEANCFMAHIAYNIISDKEALALDLIKQIESEVKL
jgi:hypothetical protein